MSKRTHPLSAGLLGAIVATGAWAWADQARLPHTFVQGGPIRADDFNENFAALASANNDNDARIHGLQRQVEELRAAARPGFTLEATGPAGNSGGTNQLGGSVVVCQQGSFDRALLAEQVSGRPFSCTLRIRTVDAFREWAPGPPLNVVPADLVLDLAFTHAFEGSFQSAGPLIETVARVTLEPGVFNDKTVTFHGVMPATPTAANEEGRFPATHWAGVRIVVNGNETMAQAGGLYVNGNFVVE